MDVKKISSIIPLLWVALSDSLGWGMAFSAAAVLILNHPSQLIPADYSDSTRYMLYEIILAIYSAFTFLFSPVLGGISDHYGRIPALKIAMSGLTIGFILCALACWWNSLILLFCGRIVAGMMAGSVSVAQAAVVDISTIKTKPTYLSMMTLVNCAGMSLGPVLGGILMHYSCGPIGVSTFLSGAAISFIGFLGILFLKETNVTNKSEEKLDIIAGFLNIKIAFSKPAINILLGVFIISIMAYVLCFSNMPIFLNRQFRTDSSTIGWVLGCFGLFLSLSLILGGKIIFKRFNVTSLTLAMHGIQVILYFILATFINSFILSCVLFFFVAITVAQLYVSLLTLISNQTESNWQGRVMGVISSLFAVPWAIGPLLAGSLNHFSVRAAFFCCVLLIGISLWLFYGTQRSHHPHLAFNKNEEENVS